mgnify:CR=1 FL=1
MQMQEWQIEISALPKNSWTGLGLYSKLAKYAGAGTLVPITGFASHPEGILLTSTMFGRMYGTEVPNVTIQAGWEQVLVLLW